jgi:hypothetical protein
MGTRRNGLEALPVGLVLLVICTLLGAAPASAIKRRVFVTSVSGSGDLGGWLDAGSAEGVAAGDAICQARAAAGGLPNSSAYRVWLSSSTTDAYCHVRHQTGKKGSCAGGPPTAAGPWYLSNGITPYTGDLDALTDDGAIYRTVLWDELLDPLPPYGELIWTGTTQYGTVSTRTCGNWQSDAGTQHGDLGDPLATAKEWSFYAYDTCDSTARLLCVETGPSEEPTPPKGSGALVFVTSVTSTGNLGSWPQAGGETGIDAGDAICRKLATAALVPAPDSFVAWLSAESHEAIERIHTDGPFRRLDGYLIASDRGDLVDGVITNSIHVDEHGDYLMETTPAAWTGTLSGGVVASSHCGNWQLGVWDGGNWGLTGRPAAAQNAYWTEFSHHPCSAWHHLYCLSNVVTLFFDGFEKTADTSRWSTP